MGNFSNATEQLVLTWLFQTGTATRPTTLAIAALTDADTPDSTSTGQFSTSNGTEVSNSGTAYARVAESTGSSNWTISWTR